MTKANDLARLTQSQVSWLVGRPASWVRENSHLFKRNANGTYDGREVFSTMAAVLGQVVITNSEFDELLEYAKNPKNCAECAAGLPCEHHGPGGVWAQV